MTDRTSTSYTEAQVREPDPSGYKRKPGPCAWIPGTHFLLTAEWSWKDVWITPHIGVTEFSNYRTLRVGWLALAFGICWPK